MRKFDEWELRSPHENAEGKRPFVKVTVKWDQDQYNFFAEARLPSGDMFRKRNTDIAGLKEEAIAAIAADHFPTYGRRATLVTLRLDRSYSPLTVVPIELGRRGPNPCWRRAATEMDPQPGTCEDGEPEVGMVRNRSGRVGTITAILPEEAAAQWVALHAEIGDCDGPLAKRLHAAFVLGSDLSEELDALRKIAETSTALLELATAGAPQ